MAEGSDEANDIEKLYEYGERLNEAKDKFQVGVNLYASCPFFLLGKTKEK